MSAQKRRGHNVTSEEFSLSSWHLSFEDMSSQRRGHNVTSEEFLVDIREFSWRRRDSPGFRRDSPVTAETVNLSATGLLNIITYVILLTIEDELYRGLIYFTVNSSGRAPLWSNIYYTAKTVNLSATGLLNIITYVILLTIEDELYRGLIYFYW